MTINIILLSLMNYYWFGLPSLIGRGLVFPGLKFRRHFISCSIFVFAVQTTFNFRELFFVENSLKFNQASFNCSVFAVQLVNP